MTFDADTKVSQFDYCAFSKSGLKSMHIPSSVEVIRESCFFLCGWLESATFDSDTGVSPFDRWHRSGHPTLTELLVGMPFLFQ
jgi:hypothetical protein